MISLLNFQDISPKTYVASIFLYSLCHLLLFSILTTQYYIKILEHISSLLNITNMYRNALFHSTVINIPRAYFLLFTDLYSYGCFINGFNTLYLSLGMALVIFNTHSKTFVQFESFSKDIFALGGCFVVQALNLTEKTFTEFQKNAAGIMFAVYLFLTIRIKHSIRRGGPAITSRVPYLLLKKINLYSTRYVFDLIILNLESFNKQSIYTSIQALISPIINTGMFLMYFKPTDVTQNILISLFLALLLGVVLMKSLNNQHFQIVNYIYGLISTLFYTIILIDRLRILINTIDFNISKKYLNTIVLPAIIALPELLNLVYYSNRNKSGMSVCSLLNSIILTTLFFNPLKRVLSGDNDIRLYAGDRISLSFAVISLGVTFFNYIMKNQKYSKDLGGILLFIYVMYNLTYLLDYSVFIKNSQ